MSALKENIDDFKSNVKFWHQTYGSVLSSLTIFISAFWTVYISPILLKFNNNEIHFTITETEKTWIVSIMDFGNFLSPIMAGYTMDKYGRKKTLIASAFINISSSIFVLFATSGTDLFFARLLAGIAKGFAFTVAPIYVAEISSKTIRGALSSSFYAFFCIGTVLSNSVGQYVSFQTYNIISLILPVFLVIMSFPMPESPYYYVMKNQHDKARHALNWYRDTTTKYTLFSTETELEEIVETIASQATLKGSYKELFVNKIFRKALFIVSMIGLAQRFGGVSYLLSYGAIDLPLSGNWFGPKECFVVYSVISVIANIPPAIYVDTVGRKPILLSSTITTSIALYIGTVYFVLHPDRVDTVNYWIPYAVVIFFSFSFTAGLGVLPATFQGEMFPSKIKRYASATLIMLLSLGSFLVNLSHEIVTNNFGVAGNYFIGATSSFIFAIYAFFYIFETKGKTLKEIQDSIMGNTPLKSHKTPDTHQGV